MVTLGDEGWFASGDGIGDGSYAYGGGEGVDFVRNLQIPTLDYGTFHLYPSSWGYDYSWGSTWIKEHNKVGKMHGKPVVLEEYGGPPSPHNHSAVEVQWQSTVLDETRVAMDQFWQFGTDFGDQLSSYDDFTIWYNDTEYDVLARQHAAAMLEKRV
jgi:mannan endo-1,4-beta-mannosidase